MNNDRIDNDNTLEQETIHEEPDKQEDNLHKKQKCKKSIKKNIVGIINLTIIVTLITIVAIQTHVIKQQAVEVDQNNSDTNKNIETDKFYLETYKTDDIVDYKDQRGGRRSLLTREVFVTLENIDTETLEQKQISIDKAISLLDQATDGAIMNLHQKKKAGDIRMIIGMLLEASKNRKLSKCDIILLLQETMDRLNIPKTQKTIGINGFLSVKKKSDDSESTVIYNILKKAHALIASKDYQNAIDILSTNNNIQNIYEIRTIIQELNNIISLESGIEKINSISMSLSNDFLNTEEQAFVACNALISSENKDTDNIDSSYSDPEDIE